MRWQPAGVQYRLRNGESHRVWIAEQLDTCPLEMLPFDHRPGYATDRSVAKIAKNEKDEPRLNDSGINSPSEVGPVRPRLPLRDSPAEPDLETRERLLRTAYELFTQEGFTSVGVDRIVAEAGVAKTSLYRYFRSKDDLVVAVLERHEALWTIGLLAAESARRAPSPENRLAALVGVFYEWLRVDGFGGCLFINSALEVHNRSPAIRAASLAALERVYELLCTFCEEAGLSETRSLAHQLQVVFRGSIVAAREGNFVAVDEARALALQLLEQHRTRTS